MKRFFYGVPWATLLWLGACSHDSYEFTEEDTADFTSEISGVVADYDGNALSNVLLTVGSVSSWTDSAGNFGFSKLASGEYGVLLRRADFRDTLLADSVSLGLLDSAVLDTVRMSSRYAVVQGTVVGSAGESFSAAGVGVDGQGRDTLATQGQFVLNHVEPGHVRLYAATDSLYGVLDTAVEAGDTLDGIRLIVSLESGTVSGTVKNRDGLALSEYAVSALGGLLQAETDLLGSFTLTGVPQDVQVLLSLSSGDTTLAQAGVYPSAGDSMSFQWTVDLSTDQNPLRILPAAFFYADSVDSVVLEASSLWDEEENIPYGYAWSLDGGVLWDTTRANFYVAPMSDTVEVLVQAFSLSGSESEKTTLSAFRLP
ncbi:MAG TPA: hypothetical protein VLM37_11170 [Fibrobacteraceae bacterium]|nr:hypothetical protein [Fibrobacteraceae bacterium]